MADKKDFLTTAPKQEQMTLENGSRFPNLKNIVGNSVDGHKELEEANITITGDEIRQQNENLWNNKEFSFYVDRIYILNQ